MPFNNVPASIAQRRNADEKPAIFAVGGTAEPQLVLEWLPSGGRSAGFFSVQIDVFRVNSTSPTFGIGLGNGQAAVFPPLVSKISVGPITGRSTPAIAGMFSTISRNSFSVRRKGFHSASACAQ